ncbi:MAG: TonB-dependent receptor [Proteobacteria bacterium]|nr:TonB-dependent receptor [Pseudomonadota bacterium]
MSRNVGWVLVGCASLAAFGVASALAAAAVASDATASPDTGSLEEIVVTATKRPERVREISGSVSAFDQSALETLGAESFSDYLTRTPGVVFNASVPGNSPAIIRGVATTTSIAQAQGTTGYFIDDVPMTDPFYSAGIPDIDTFDVNNVTVLRGPQGTLFGSSSMGGAVNYEAARPDLTRLDAHVRGNWDRNGHDEDGYGAHGMLNVPIIDDVLAIRGVYGRRQVAGFVDNIGTGQKGSNQTTIQGGRVLVTFAPAAGTRLNYLFLDQTESTADAGSTQTASGLFAKNTLIPEPFRYRTGLHNLRLDQELGFATLTATATHHEKVFSSQQDYSGLVPDLAPIAFLEPGTSRGETFEVRLASAPGRRFDYLIGAFYDSTSEHISDMLDAPAAASLFGTSRILEAPVAVHGRESALFGEGTWHFNDQLKATFGGRWFHTKLDTVTTQEGPFAGPTTSTAGGSRESGFSPKASITWQPGRDTLIYALASRGFRFGGPNIARDPAFAIPSQFNSDSLWNYELGTRITALNSRLLLDGTLYWIDWSNIQVTQTSPSHFIYTANAGRARNRGVEASATYRVLTALSLQGAVTYLDGVLRRDFDSGAGLIAAGSQLPGASKWQISDSIVYAPVGAQLAPTITLSHRYISSAPGELLLTPQKQGNYNLFNFRAGVTVQHYGVSLYVDNLGNRRGVSQASTGVLGPVEFLVAPRTFGITLDYKL